MVEASMKRIRLATAEEVESIKDVSDLDQGCNVFALDTAAGTGLAVRRMCQEIDPLITPGWNPRQRSLFIRDIETVLHAQGGTSYYFNVDPDDSEWIGFIKGWGAEQVSPQPMLRFKRTL
jgi:hypothetical protein